MITTFFRKQTALPVFITLTILFLFSACKRHGSGTMLDASPLSPFTDDIKYSKDEDVGPERKDGIKIQFYAIDEDVKFSRKFQIRIEEFIEKAHRADITENKAIYFRFYKTSSALDKDGKYTKEELESKHLDDKFADFEYLGGKLYNVEFFKKGQYYTPNDDEMAEE
jgi:hypothetical protein